MGEGEGEPGTLAPPLNSPLVKFLVADGAENTQAHQLLLDTIPFKNQFCDLSQFHSCFSPCDVKVAGKTYIPYSELGAKTNLLILDQYV